MTFEEFKILTQLYNVIPVSKSLLADTLTPVSAYLRLREHCASSFLLESVEGGERFARYSFIGRDPHIVITCHDTTTTVTRDGKKEVSHENYFDILNRLISKYHQPSLPNLPRFNGGLVGFIGYDAVRFIEKIPSSGHDQLQADSIMGLFTSILAFDHLKHQIIIIVNAIIDPTKALQTQYDEAVRTTERLEELLLNAQPPSRTFSLKDPEIKSQISAGEYQAMVLKAKHHIVEGDVFQVVLSQRFSTAFEGDVFNVYRTLRVINPSPYLYFLDFAGYRVIGSSPEILVRVEDGVAEVYPIAGTRPRGMTDSDDADMERDLLSDEKECAEHVMLVDLGRNDLGRVCEIGSVHVDQLMTVVRYSHVMHIASRVVGKVLPSTSCIDVLKATFPAGTVSGAPKIRAMEIIDELEVSRRGIYAGGIGYLDFSGNMDVCIAIRTMFAEDGIMYLQAGAGIVADSIPEKEYQETVNKSRALIEALHMAEGIIH